MDTIRFKIANRRPGAELQVQLLVNDEVAAKKTVKLDYRGNARGSISSPIIDGGPYTLRLSQPGRDPQDSTDLDAGALARFE